LEIVWFWHLCLILSRFPLDSQVVSIVFPSITLEHQQQSLCWGREFHILSDQSSTSDYYYSFRQLVDLYSFTDIVKNSGPPWNMQVSILFNDRIQHSSVKWLILWSTGWFECRSQCNWINTH
jgi:hypothetical protein